MDEGFPDDVGIETDGDVLTCRDAIWHVARALALGAARGEIRTQMAGKLRAIDAVPHLRCSGVYANEGGGLFWEVRGRGMGRHLVWQEGGRVRSMLLSAGTLDRYGLVRVPDLKVLGILKMNPRSNPRTALRWRYDRSKERWTAIHDGFVWGLERRHGGDVKHPREYLYKKKGDWGWDRVAKRDVAPATTPSARKRRNVQAKEWAESFIFSPLELLGRA